MNNNNNIYVKKQRHLHPCHRFLKFEAAALPPAADTAREAPGG